MKLPRLRPLEFIPHRAGEIQGFIIRDPLMLSGNVMFVPEPVVFILSFFNGEKEMVDLQESFMKRYGEMLFSEDVEKLIEDLDNNLLLENENYFNVLRKLKEGYKNSLYRKLFSLPKTYTDFEELRERIKKAVNEGELPGYGIISPHIDYERGMQGYALAYSGWKGLEGKTLIFLGVNHTPFEDDFILSSKGYETPWGPVETDLEVLNAIGKLLENPYENEIAHAFEHSIELNVSFLKALVRDFKMVALLVPSFSEYIERGTLPVGYEKLFELLHFLAEDEKYVLVSAADLSHYGLRFGDQEKAENLLPYVESFDKTLLKKAQEGDRDGFLSLFFSGRNATHVCGTGAIYVFLKSIKRKGKLLGYFNALDTDRTSAVSFAALIY